MISYFQKILSLPEGCIDYSPLPKNFFEKKFKLTSSEAKMLKVAYLPERITWMASIKPQNTSIPIYQSGTESYNEVQVFVVHLLTDHYENYADRIVHLIHKYIPYQSLVIIHDQLRYQISCSQQRINQVADEKRVLDQVYTSPMCSLSLRNDIQIDMEDRISFNNISHASLHSLYRSYIEAIVVARANETFGDNIRKYTLEELWQSVRKAKQDEVEIKSLKEKIRNAQTLKEKVGLQEKLTKLRQL